MKEKIIYHIVNALILLIVWFFAFEMGQDNIRREAIVVGAAEIKVLQTNIIKGWMPVYITSFNWKTNK